MSEGAFSGRRVVVTGAGAGIGRGIATAFVQEGAWVAAVDVVADRVKSVVAELGGGPGRAFGVAGDVRTAAGVDRIVQGAVGHLGRIEVLVNNAAVYPNCPVIEMPEEQWDAVIETNLKGTFLMSREVARRMVSERVAGHIVNIASGAYRSARRGASHYCASKAAIVMFSKVLAQELAEHRIHVNVVSPGLIDVGRRGDVNPAYRETLITNIPWGRMGQPAEIAEAVLFLSSTQAEYITGSVLDVSGGSSAGRYFLPYSRG
ncbi:MAG TPA: SDR family NAD(P)-dependent oxidoreductase [bacterium]|nr:SDR family NAD(P)-dependent oxidoreductase [bacterium]